MSRRLLEGLQIEQWGSVVLVIPLPHGWSMTRRVRWLVRSLSSFCDFAARGNSVSSVRSYAYVLLRWWRWLATVDVVDRATQAEVRDLTLWLQLHPKPQRRPRTVSASTAGTTNQLTGKRYLDDQYAACTIRHGNAVISSFYEFWGEQGLGPVVNPVARDYHGHGRANAHHNPMNRYVPEGRIRAQPQASASAPSAMTDEAWGHCSTP